MKRPKLIPLLASVILSFALLFPCRLQAFADVKADADVIVSMQIGNSIMEVNGVETAIDPGRSTKPIILNGRTLVPIRAIVEAFGGDVGWDSSSGTISLDMDGDTIRLHADSNLAFFNGTTHSLDVAPVVIDGRTLLPIRFVAESFNLGVAWENDTKTVSIIRNSFDQDEYNHLMSILPDYSGKSYVPINGNVPFFEDYEIIEGSFEYYSKLDSLGRCDVCFASVAEDIMPTEERESISSVTPTGWINKSYPHVSGGYLYNRCHLIGFQLTGENANKQNLITGTRYLNAEGMLPFENRIADYIENTGNRVMYRSTPVFSGDNLVADGVLLEALSVEDEGRGISFCVFCYNVQPQIRIDYATGHSISEVGDSAALSKDSSVVPEEASVTLTASGVYRTPTGKRYHFSSACGGKNSYSISLEEALKAGLTPCSKCAR